MWGKRSEARASKTTLIRRNNEMKKEDEKEGRPREGSETSIIEGFSGRRGPKIPLTGGSVSTSRKEI